MDEIEGTPISMETVDMTSLCDSPEPTCSMEIGRHVGILKESSGDPPLFDICGILEAIYLLENAQHDPLENYTQGIYWPDIPIPLEAEDPAYEVDLAEFIRPEYLQTEKKAEPSQSKRNDFLSARTDSVELEGTDSAELEGTDSAELEGTDSAELEGTDSAELEGTDSAELEGTEVSTEGFADASSEYFKPSEYWSVVMGETLMSNQA